MNILTTEQLIELIDASAINANDIMGTKGIMNVSDWSHASPITLGQLIRSLLSKIPETYWIVSAPDPDKNARCTFPYIRRGMCRDAYGSRSLFCRLRRCLQMSFS